MITKHLLTALVLFSMIAFPSISQAVRKSISLVQEIIIPQTAGQTNSDKDEIERIVRESQMYETLVIYTNPKAFDKEQLKKYWVPAEQGGDAVNKVIASVNRLLNVGWHYGKESKNNVFEIRSIKVLPSGVEAEVQTREHWYVPLYDESENRVPNRDPYMEFPNITYTLRKINGKWLLQTNTTTYKGDKK